MFAIPSLGDLTARARNAMRSNLPGSDAWLWPNNVGPTAKLVAGGAHEIFGFADSIQQAKFALTAEGEDLDRHAQERGLARIEPKAASGQALVTTGDQVAVAFGAIFQRNDGVQYKAIAAASLLTAGTVSVPIVASVNGADTTTLAGTSLLPVSGVTDPGGTPTVVVDSNGLTGGADQEEDGAKYNPPPGTLRYRVLFAKRNPPQGGAPSDYVLWASEVPGVTRVFVERKWNGFGTVRIFPLMEDTYANGIPQPADITRIANFIDSVGPSGAVVSVVAPSAVPVNITVASLLPSTPAVQSAIIAELKQTFRRLSAVAGNDAGNAALAFLAVPTSFALQWIWQSVANAAGESRGKVTSPSADTALSAGQIATLGTMTWA